jgi:hypothetical protein
MKQKGTVARKHPAGDEQILCPKCGNDKFKRSLSEIDSIVRLEFAKSGKAVKETVVSEGKIDFSYFCTTCDEILFNTQA